MKLVPKRPRWEQGEVRYVPDPDRAREVTLGAEPDTVRGRNTREKGNPEGTPDPSP
jgi:hypothetical protein